MASVTPPSFKGRHFQDRVIVWCVRWYLRYCLSHRTTIRFYLKTLYEGLAVPSVYIFTFVLPIGLLVILTPSKGIASTTCQTMALSMEGGTVYKGTVRNERYGFSLLIPAHQLAWGVKAPAPFHGFTIFLDGAGNYREGNSCLDLYVGTRVRLPEDNEERRVTQATSSRVAVGNRQGTQTIEQVVDGEVSLIVVNIRVEPLRSAGDDYMSLTLICPAEKYAENRMIFDRLLAHLTFW